MCVSDTAQLLLPSALFLMNKIQLMRDAGHFWFAGISESVRKKSCLAQILFKNPFWIYFYCVAQFYNRVA